MKSIVYLIVVGLFLMLSGCASLWGDKVPDFQDGTWSSCTFKKEGSDKVHGPFPFQLPPGMPIPDITDAIEVKCEPIPPRPTAPAAYIPNMKWDRQAKDTVKI